MAHDDFAFEPVRGLPAHLPEGEHIVWQGAPQRGALAIRAFHTRKVALYFGLLMIWRFASSLSVGKTAGAALGYAMGILPLAIVAIGILYLLAWGYARSSVYTLTNKRLVIRSGIAMPITLNLPFTKVESIGLRPFADGTGDIAITVEKGERIAALVLWPHMRPWNWNHPQPMLRSIADAEAVARKLTQTLNGDASTLRISKQMETGTAPPILAAHA
jgi:hypothetical protein